MSIIFSKLKQHAEDLRTILSTHCTPKNEEHSFPWDNYIYESPYVRRAHIDVVDRIDSKKLYMMHLCVFPNTSSSVPIYGFDIIAGPNKVTGAFLDFSPIGDREHPYCNYFIEQVKKYSWSKPRELPEWARNIFSSSMVAAGNISTEEELEEVLTLTKKLLIYYFDNLPLQNTTSEISYLDKQNYYCINQKQNPHTPRVMQSLGYSPEVVKEFIETCLFPEV